MNRKSKLTAMIKSYFRWPVWLSLLLVAMDISIYFIDKRAVVMMSIYVFVYIVIAIVLYRSKRVTIFGEIVRFAAEYGQVQKQLLKELSLPYAVLDIDGHLLWGNDEFIDVIVNERAARRSIMNIFPEITKDNLPHVDKDTVLHVEFQNRNYRLVLRRTIAKSFNEGEDEYDVDYEKSNLDNSLIALYMYDETEITSYIKENQEQRMVVGLLYIDNYEEALESIDEVRRSLLIALVDRKINKYMQSMDAIVKKLEKDKYIFMFKYRYLNQLQNNKFSLLEEVRGVNIGNDMAVTLSMGLGVNADTYTIGYDYARAAIDLALGRGGDQAVVKEGEKLLYYGGKSMQVEKNTRVKARVKAHALKELVEAKDKVVIMGHSIGDVDSFGAAIGIYRVAKTLNKRAHIIINQVTSSVRPLMDRFLDNPEYESDMILTSDQAMEVVDNNTLLVIVDVNRPNYTECIEVLSLTKTIVILDHHRQTGEAVENAVLSYIEPYASSTCEMVAEILQYIGEGLRLKQAEADAMYAGIMIDTNNFLSKTGVRTFEAAAYLKRSGADVTKIRKAFRCDMMDYKVQAESVSNVEVFLDYYAITECIGHGVESPTIIGAKVANELLNITNVKASFVLTEFKGKIYISARSIDELNVQIVMEKLGGGGHMTIAGAQLTDCTMEEAINLVKETLKRMQQEGEL